MLLTKSDFLLMDNSKFIRFLQKDIPTGAFYDFRDYIDDIHLALEDYFDLFSTLDVDKFYISTLADLDLDWDDKFDYLDPSDEDDVDEAVRAYLKPISIWNQVWFNVDTVDNSRMVALYVLK